jgi:excisionase family DNA binding protein
VYHLVYAAIRRYKVPPDESPGALRQALEEFTPHIKELQGLLAYYVLDAGDGLIATISICTDSEKVEASNRMASEWLRRYLVSNVYTQDTLTSISLQIDDPLQGPLYEGFSEPVYKQDLQLLSVQEVSEVLGMGRSWVYQQIRSEEMPSVHLGGTVKVRRKDLQEYVQRRSRPQRADEDE